MTSVNDLPAKWRSEINGCAIDNCTHCLSLAVALNELEAALAQQAGSVESDEFPFILEIGTNGKPTGYWFRNGSKAADRYLANKADEVSDDMIDVALASAWGHKMRGDDTQRSLIRGMLQAVRREYPGYLASSGPGGGGEVLAHADHPDCNHCYSLQADKQECE